MCCSFQCQEEVNTEKETHGEERDGGTPHQSALLQKKNKMSLQMFHQHDWGF